MRSRTRAALVGQVIVLLISVGVVLGVARVGNARSTDVAVLRPYQDDATAASLAAIETTLKRSPPAVDATSERLRALGELDRLLQDPAAAQRPAIVRFFHRRIDEAVAEMRRRRVRSGALVWHIYNQGFVVRTADATLCFDLVRARYLGPFAIDREQMASIVDACDVLFVSHVHADHAERFVAQTFVDQGKPVVAPSQVRFPVPLNGWVTRLDRDRGRVHALPLRNGVVILEVVVYPGHQGADIDNNVVLVRAPDGTTVAHTGDQWDPGDFSWIDRVGAQFRVDILLPNDWTYDIARLVRGFGPALVVPGHANELGHTVAKRQPYLLSYARKVGSSRFGGQAGDGYDAPLLVLTWGESYHYPGRNSIASPGRGGKPG